MPAESLNSHDVSGQPIRLGGKKSDLAYDALKRAIVLRQYQPGQKIREQSIAGEFQCSQSTVREALINLSQDGLVTRSGYHGTYITDTTLEEAAVFVQVRLTIERSVAAQLHTRRKTLDTTPVNEILTAMDETHAAGDLFQCSELDRRFHAQLAIMADMEQLAPVLQRCALHIHRFTLGNVEVPRDFFQEAGVGDEHRSLLQSLCKGTAKQSQKAMSQHLGQVLQHWAPSLYSAVGANAF